MRHALKVGEVVRNQCALRFQRRGRNEQIGIGEQGALPMEFAIQRGRALHHLIGERQDQTGLTEEGKCGFLCPGLFGLESTQQFIAGDDRESESVMFGKITPHPLRDQWMLFEEFGENISVEDDGRLRH